MDVLALEPGAATEEGSIATTWANELDVHTSNMHFLNLRRQGQTKHDLRNRGKVDFKSSVVQEEVRQPGGLGHEKTWMLWIGFV